MNCRTFRKNCVELLDSGPGKMGRELSVHLDACPSCATYYEEMSRTLAGLEPSDQTTASERFKERVMTQIIGMDSSGAKAKAAASARRRVWRPALAVAAAVLLIGGVSLYNAFRPNNRLPGLSAFTVLAQAAEAIAELQSVHISARMRTPPADNFEQLSYREDLLPHDMWKEFGPFERWRVEKPGRVVVMDGQESVLWIKPPHNIAAKGGRKTGMVDWIMPLLDPHLLLDREMVVAQRQGSELTLEEEVGEDGRKKRVLTIAAEAQGDFSNDYAKNGSIKMSDHCRIYRFDAETSLLESGQVYVRKDGEDILVFEIVQVDYDVAIDPELFALQLPEDVIWAVLDPEPLEDNEKYAQMTPKEVAHAFFQACADENWEEALKYYPLSEMPENMKNLLGGLEVIHIGKPFQSGLYGGWFVPYEVKWKSGRTKKHNVAVRNDNPAKRWLVDGGI